MTSYQEAAGASCGSGIGGELREALEKQRQNFHLTGAPSAEIRIDRIDRVIDLIVSNVDAILDVLNEDYGHRSRSESFLYDVAGPLPTIKHTRKHVRQWMRPRRYRTGALRLLGAKAWIEWQPLGVVGVISPWNFPVSLTFEPVSEAFAAGNAVMVKLSELVPNTSELLRSEIAARFDPTELRAFTGGPEVGAEFASLPFDHILFTGSSDTGRKLQRAAAENLVPLTLELGGKSPVLVSPKADLRRVADRVMIGKTMNAGQVCLSPDYVLVNAGREEQLVEQCTATVRRMFPHLLDNDNYSSIVDARHYDRLTSLLDDARAKGARIIEINPASEDFTRQPAHKIAPTLVLNVTADMRIMREEIFGPLLPIVTYRHIDDAVLQINSRPKPLAAYYFGPNDDARQRFLSSTSSGGVTINDVTLHSTVPGMPFGGVGESGMGSYHGRAGFETFSHARGILSVARKISPSTILAAPYGRVKARAMRMLAVFELRAVRRRQRSAERKQH